MHLEQGSAAVMDLNIQSEDFIPLGDSSPDSAIVPVNNHVGSAEVPTIFMFARTVMFSLQQPSIYVGTKSLLMPNTIPVSLLKFVQQKDVSVLSRISTRRVARRLCFDATPTTGSSMILFDPSSDSSDTGIVENTVSEFSTSVVAVNKSRRKKKIVPQVTTAVRRSPRNHAIAGHKVSMPTDSKKRKSKVKAIVVPGDRKESVQPGHSSGKGNTPPPPPPTPVKVLQKIGVNICGIPIEELEESKLQKEKSHEDEVEEDSEDDEV
jgi:hypothetical protein